MWHGVVLLYRKPQFIAHQGIKQVSSNDTDLEIHQLYHTHNEPPAMNLLMKALTKFHPIWNTDLSGPVVTLYYMCTQLRWAILQSQIRLYCFAHTTVESYRMCLCLIDVKKRFSIITHKIMHGFVCCVLFGIHLIGIYPIAILYPIMDAPPS